jgi:hypothetical protein
MKKLIYGGLFLAAVGIGFVGCKKDNMNKLERSQNSALEFNSMEELKSKIKELESMNEEDRRTYENQNGYKSLYTQVHTVYEEINMDEIKDTKEIYDHVNRNKNLLEIAKNVDGELEYRPFYSDNPYSFVASENRMVIVDSLCLKIFDDGLVSTNIENFENLENQESKSVKKLNLNGDFNISYFTTQDIISKSNCGINREARATSGNNRTKITLECYAVQIGGFVPSGEASGLIRPYKKTLGIWYYAQRTISGRFKFDFAYEENGTNHQGDPGSGETEEISIDHTVSPTLAYAVSRTFPMPTGGFYPFNYRFSSILSWGTTPDTNNASITCN